ncbi:MAG: hypothetical protein P8I94_00450 [Emcibacteraceae bacterium]|nr:hypothetical protein [Emcibacteraceae bacterium]
MDLNKVGLHINELRNQFSYIEIGVGLFNQSLEKNSVTGAFFALQSIFESASHVSKTLWAPRKKGRARSEALRKFLGAPDDHPLNNKDIQSLFDYSDEANEQWIKDTTGKYILMDYIGDLAESPHKDVEIANIFRSFDTKGKIYVYRGVGFHMENVMLSLKTLSDAVNKAHYHIFPDQWNEAPTDGKEDEASKTVN